MPWGELGMDMTVAEAKLLIERYEVQQKNPVPASIEETIPFMDFRFAQAIISCHDRMRPIVEALERLTGFIDKEGPAAKEWEEITLWNEKGKEALLDYAKLKGEGSQKIV